ncbi:MAG TPA: ABC transporter permease [Gaiellaceae bacterium]|nr:ABC transporter permease [Gaiellaceae bacterium]
MSGALTAPEAAMPSRPGEKPVLEVTGGPGRASWSALAELAAFRGVLWAFALRDVKVKYKQAAIGIGWAVLQPVLAALVFALFLGRYAGVASEGAPYALFALAGLVAWTYFSGASATAMESLVSDQALLRKIYFPREVVPLAAVVAGLVDLVPGVVVLLLAALAYGAPVGASWAALPLAFAPLVTFGAALGLGLSAVNVYYRDVRYALPFVLQLGLFASPVVYSLDAVPESWRTFYAIANPVAAAIDGTREIVLHGSWPRFALLGAALAWSLLLLVGGYTLFKRLERGFSDRV